MADRFEKVLLAIDFSASTDDVIAIGVKFARNYNAQLRLLNVVEEGFAFSGLDGMSLPVEDLATLQHYSASRLASLQDKMDALVVALQQNGLEVEGRVIEGHPAAMIVDEAERGGFDAIFMGSHGWSGIKKFLMGSVAENVVKNSRCSVMVVRAAVED
ncbi:MAG: universal stress protein [Candidatus Aegiribacteria sp.]|nr:universal stress protein [Candidatus Aegiribacteria sp.]